MHTATEYVVEVFKLNMINTKWLIIRNRGLVLLMFFLINSLWSLTSFSTVTPTITPGIITKVVINIFFFLPKILYLFIEQVKIWRLVFNTWWSFLSPLTKVKLINELNEREAHLGIKESVSWHSVYRDSAWIFVGNRATPRVSVWVSELVCLLWHSPVCFCRRISIRADWRWRHLCLLSVRTFPTQV